MRKAIVSLQTSGQNAWHILLHPLEKLATDKEADDFVTYQSAFVTGQLFYDGGYSEARRRLWLLRRTHDFLTACKTAQT